MPIEEGQRVFVPFTALDQDPNGGRPFVQAEVITRIGKSATLRLPDGTHTNPIGIARLSHNIGILVVRIGDYVAEATLLDPLYKSVVQFTRMLVSDEFIRGIQIRTTQELQEFWNQNHGAYEQVVLLGHGSPQGLTFGTQLHSAAEVADIFDVNGVGQKEFISLCCETGTTRFAREFSTPRVTQNFIAPLRSVHGCIAAQFVQTYLTHRLLDGMTLGPAFTNARSRVLQGTRFRRFVNGIHIA